MTLTARNLKSYVVKHVETVAEGTDVRVRLFTLARARSYPGITTASAPIIILCSKGHSAWKRAIRTK
jgi:hypothetical protein